MNDVASEMIKLAIETTNNTDIAKGLQIALELIAESGYTSISGWEEMTDREQLEHVGYYINEMESEVD